MHGAKVRTCSHKGCTINVQKEDECVECMNHKSKLAILKRMRLYIPILGCVMASTSEDDFVAFASLICAIHDVKRDSFWNQILDDDKDIPDRLPTNTDNETKKGVVNCNTLSLR